MTQTAESAPPPALSNAILTVGRADAAEPAPCGEIDQLVAAVLDLESGYETALRTVLSVHRLLERVRRCGPASAEGRLLLQEMSRKLGTLSDGISPIATILGQAGTLIAAVVEPSH